MYYDEKKMISRVIYSSRSSILTGSFCDLRFFTASLAFELNGCKISLLELLVLMLNLLAA